MAAHVEDQLRNVLDGGIAVGLEHGFTECFERPDERVRGWETARQAQDRIVRAVDRVIDLHDGRGDIAIMAHGAVGTFLLCHLKGVPISMAEAQPGRDGGHYFRFEAGTGRLLEGWTRIDPT